MSPTSPEGNSTADRKWSNFRGHMLIWEEYEVVRSHVNVNFGVIPSRFYKMF